MPACARAACVTSGAETAASAAVNIVLRLIMVIPCHAWPNRCEHSRSGRRALFNRPLWPRHARAAPGQRQQRHVMAVPLANRLRALAHEGIFYRLSLADGDMQSEQDHGHWIGPPGKG